MTCAPVVAARRMGSANTLFATRIAGKLIEVNTAGKVVWSHAGLSIPTSAQPLENGNILVTLQGGSRIIELSKDKKTVWEQRNLQGLMDAQKLPNGNVLVATQNGVREIDREGKTVNANRLPKPATSGNRRSGRYRGGYGGFGGPENLTNRVYRY